LNNILLQKDIKCYDNSRLKVQQLPHNEVLSRNKLYQLPHHLAPQQEHHYMKRISSTLIALAAMAITASTSSAQSTKPVSLGISAGAAIPVSDIGNDYSTGYNGTVSLMFNSPGSPIGFRVDGMYNNMSGQDFTGFPAIKIMSANANVVYALPGVGIRPYLIGGAGVYTVQEDFSGAPTQNKLGLNGGIGASFPLSGFNTFVEARVHRVLNTTVGPDFDSITFIPITFGIAF
jgi:hypothetical protein